MQDVVVIAVSAAVMAATITFRTSSRIFCLLFMALKSLRKTPSDSPIKGGEKGDFQFLIF